MQCELEELTAEDYIVVEEEELEMMLASADPTIPNELLCDEDESSGSETVNAMDTLHDELHLSDAAVRDLDMLAAVKRYRENVVHGFHATMIERGEILAFCKLPDAMVLEHMHPMPAFDRTRFFDVNPDDPTDTHYYEVWNEHTQSFERPKASVTKIAHSPFPEFDDDAQATRIANSNRRFGEYAFKSKEEILDMWALGNQSGSALHKSAEYFFNHYADMPDHVRVSNIFITQEFGYLLNFIEREMVGKLDMVRTEVRLCDFAVSRRGTTAALYVDRGDVRPRDPIMQVLLPMTKLAGSADFILQRRGAAPNVFQIGDLKRCKNIRYEAFDASSFGKWPCDDLPDCNYSQYCLQLNIYKWMMHNCTNYEIERMFLLVCHPNYDDYECIEVPDMQHKVQRIMIQRLRTARAKLYTSDSAEDVRYRAEIDAFLAALPADPTDLIGSFCRDKREAVHNKSIDEALREAKQIHDRQEMAKMQPSTAAAAAAAASSTK